MMKKVFAATAMLAFLGMGATQLFAKVNPVENLRTCYYTEEGRCIAAYSGAALSDCVATFGRLICFYADGTTKQVTN